VAVVVFLSLYEFAELEVGTVGVEAEVFGAAEVFLLFVRETLGGAVLGGLLGWLGLKALRLVMQPTLDILVTLAVVMGGYALAEVIHVSGPLALVVAGLMMASRLRGKDDLSRKEREYVDIFWESLDEILNAVLFVLMGLVILSVAESFTFINVVAMLLAIGIVLSGRVISVGLSVMVTKLRCGKSPGRTMAVLSWGGLRGGISVALALSLRPEMSRELIVFVTYGVVVFSILVQGLTIGPLIRKLGLKAER
jgi:CPA1 family monovalent cation:H+ antiporter